MNSQQLVFPTALLEFPTWKINTTERNSEPTTHWNSAEMAKVCHKKTDKVSRRQGKEFLFDSCSLFSTLKYVCKFPIYAFSKNTQVIKQLARSYWLAISDYHPIITSTDKMAASSRFATVSEDDFALKCFFFFSFLN